MQKKAKTLERALAHANAFQEYLSGKSSRFTQADRRTDIVDSASKYITKCIALVPSGSDSDCYKWQINPNNPLNVVRDHKLNLVVTSKAYEKKGECYKFHYKLGRRFNSTFSRKIEICDKIKWRQFVNRMLVIMNVTECWFRIGEQSYTITSFHTLLYCIEMLLCMVNNAGFSKLKYGIVFDEQFC